VLLPWTLERLVPQYGERTRNASAGRVRHDDTGIFPTPIRDGRRRQLAIAAKSRAISLQRYRIGNVDATLIAQAPKFAPFIEPMRDNMAGDLGCDVSQVSVKATTTEHLGFAGRKEGIAAFAAVLLVAMENQSGG
jgi:2C-methyl-D-erythritol 2,4-cyclodiphosphate synthase